MSRRSSELIGPPQSSDVPSGIGAAFGGLPDASYDSDCDSDSNIDSDTDFDTGFEMPSFF